MTMTTSSTSRTEKFVLRLPEGMRDRIAQVAKNNRRSMNSEILSRLERSMSPAQEADETTEEHLNGREQQFLFQFRGLSQAQQQALLDFLSSD